MIEQYLIKCLLSYDLFVKYAQYVDEKFLKTNVRELATIFHFVKELHRLGEGKDYTVDDLAVVFFSNTPTLSEGQKGLYNSLFSSIRELQVSHDLAEGFFQQHLERVRASQIAEKCVDVLEGKAPFEDVINMLGDEERPTVDQGNIVSDSIDDLANQVVHGKGLYWRSEFLNKSIGPLRKGNFGFYFGRPEMGKTAFFTSEGSFMAEQLEDDEHLIVVLNEEPGQKTKLRFYCAALGVPLRDLIANKVEYQQVLVNKFGRKLVFYDDAGVNRYSVERLCKEYKPGLIWIDQLDKVYGFTGERPDIAFKKQYQWARELSKKYAPVVGVCQAGGTAEGKMYLDLDDVDGSRTAKQGEADWIIGIGKNDNEFLRGYSLLKNKLGDDPNCEPALRHGRAEAIITPEISRYEDVE